MRSRIVRPFRAQPRILSATLVGVLLLVLLPHGWRGVTRLLIVWDGVSGLYLLMALDMMLRSRVEKIRLRAELQDSGKLAVLALTTLTALISLAAIVAQLAHAKQLQDTARWQHIALAGATVLLSWTFTHTIFAIHYAHEYYAGPEGALSEGLKFPGEKPPDYWDFVYYAFVIGTACATADVAVTTHHMRRITTTHCIVAFFFNTIILALTINIGSDFL